MSTEGFSAYCFPDLPLVLLGPGFEKETLAEDLKKIDPETFRKVYVYHTGQSGMCGINGLHDFGDYGRIRRCFG